MQAPPVVKDLVLVGGGHSHIEVLRKFGMKPLPGVRLTLVTRDVHTPYSGMLPGYVSGFYSYDDCHVDLARLSRWAATRFVHAEARAIDTQAQEVLLHGRPAIPYDVLSINIGITPAASSVPGAAQHATTVKPIDRFVARFEALLQRVRAEDRQLRVAVVGAGAAGVELACALRYRFALEREQHSKAAPVTVSLVSRGPLLPNLAPYARSAFLPLLKERGVEVHEVEGGVAEVAPSLLLLADGRQLPYDECLWCTQAGAAAWVAASGLPTDEEGFLAVNEFLQSAGGPPNVFAAGDIAAFVASPRPKAGVFAVRAGPPLAENLRRQLLGQPLQPFLPQRTYLNLLSAGDKYAVAVKGWLGTQGAWCWRLKDWIDTGFMAKYSSDLEFGGGMRGAMGAGATAPQLPAALGAEALALASAAKMRCGGCGSKVGATTLGRVLRRLQECGTAAVEASSNDATEGQQQVQGRQEGKGGDGSEVLVGLGAPDDAAVIRPPPPGYVTVHTVDFFRALVDDPFTFGKIAANHALGDCYAMGAQPEAALAIAVVPFAAAAKVESDLYQMMAGAASVLGAAGCQLAGGHSSEGAELALGFSVYGKAQEGSLLTKAGLRPGQVLVLTKPLGTGTILAAHMAGGAKGRWVQGAVDSMVQSSGPAMEVIRRHGATACTDVTGFGLLGHLQEMAAASQVCVRLDPSAVPLLPGAIECATAHLSSLHEENARVVAWVQDPERAAEHPLWPLLVDPQTGGGLLASLPASEAEACIAELRPMGYASSNIVGAVLSQQQGEVVDVAGEALRCICLG